MEEKILSDSQIASQYDNFIIEEIEAKHCRYSDGFSGIICISFPEADHPDFDEWVCDNWISYDSAGERIAFDRWYPDDVLKVLRDRIREEIKKIS